MKKQALNILLDTLTDTNLDTPCTYLPREWCEKNCENDDGLTRKCWKKYAKLKARESEDI